jgi:hypothetical protein
MKLIVVEKSKVATFNRLKRQFVDDPDVQVVLERRRGERDASATDERRRLRKAFEAGRDYIVIHTAAEPTDRKKK